jgi:riboflavin biosynthesis pyrimidine reductase
MVSRSLDLDLDAPVFTEPIVPTIVLTCASADATALAAAQEVADVAVVGDEDVDLQTALEALHQRGLRRVHCEGGPHLLAQLVADDLLDELLLTISPLLVGGSAQVPLLRILSGTELPDPPRRLTLQHVLEDDGTLFLRYRRA